MWTGVAEAHVKALISLKVHPVTGACAWAITKKARMGFCFCFGVVVFFPPSTSRGATKASGQAEPGVNRECKLPQ